MIEITGQPFSSQKREQSSHLSDWQIKKIALVPVDRKKLHIAIANRFHEMLSQGFIDEVEKLFNRGDLHLGLPSMRSVGYRQIWQFLDGKLSKEEMIDKSIVATRQLAKRQFTWLRKWDDLNWLDNEQADLVDAVLKFIKQ